MVLGDMGLDYDYFMDLTPYLWSCKYKGYCDKLEREAHNLAWQTALLMNATGNLKEPVTIEMLLGSKQAAETSKVSSGSTSLLDSARWVAVS